MATEPTSEPRARRPVRLAAEQAGDPESELLRELHEQHAGPLWTYALTLTGDPDQAEDVVQETLLRACRDPRTLQPGCGSQRSWLLTVARNIVIDEWCTALRRPEDVIVRRSERPVSDARAQLVNGHLALAALRWLTREHRDVLRECYVRGSAVAQAAHAMEGAPDVVKSRAYYALHALRLAIEELEGVL